MSTQDLEKAVRDAAGNLLTAINDAKAAGLDVRWPGFPGGLAVIAISQTGKVSAAMPAAAAPSTVTPSAIAGGLTPAAQPLTPAATPVADTAAAKTATTTPEPAPVVASSNT